MANGTDAAVEALGEVIEAYKKRSAELERIVLEQQKVIEELRGQGNHAITAPPKRADRHA